MLRPLSWILCLMLAPLPVLAGTFDRAPIAPELGLDDLNRAVARERLGRDLFANPYATVTLSTVDLYAAFPYVETRQFQVVSDPRWNRLVYGERGGSLRAFGAAGDAMGGLRAPHGMAVDERQNVYVADTGHDRILVLEARTAQGDIELVPRFAITGLSGPYDVAYSDGGTPFVPGDDHLYVADTGHNRIVAFALGSGDARAVAALGELGGGVGRFAGPLAIATGRGPDHARDLYVADAHSRRIVHLRHEAGGLRWIGDAHTEADVVTSLDTDAWGNVYAAAPRQGSVQKWSPALQPVAELRDGFAAPRSFRVPFTVVRDHRDGTTRRREEPSAVTAAEWAPQSGIRLWKLGVQVGDVQVSAGDRPSATFLLTDRATVAYDVTDAVSGRVLAHGTNGTLDAGAHTLALPELASAGAANHQLVLRLAATSAYSERPGDVALTTFHMGEGPALQPARSMLFANRPNPAAPWTRIAFNIAGEPDAGGTLNLYDALGRKVRTFAGGFAPGWNQVLWDGTDDHGHPVQAGVYFYELLTGHDRLTHRMVLVR